MCLVGQYSGSMFPQHVAFWGLPVPFLVALPCSLSPSGAGPPLRPGNTHAGSCHSPTPVRHGRCFLSPL